MTGRIVYEAPRKHHCNPGWRNVRRPAPWDPATNVTFCERVDQGTPAKSIWECQCGRTFIAYYIKPHRRDRFVSLSVHWRPEGRLRRWRRTLGTEKRGGYPSGNLTSDEMKPPTIGIKPADGEEA